MNKAHILVSIAVAAATTLLAGQPDLSKLPPASSRKGVTYQKDIRPLFETACFRCHGDQQQKGGIRLDNLESVLRGGKEGKILLPGKAKESALLIAVSQIDEEKAMPPRFKPRGPGGSPPPGGPGAGNPHGPGNGPQGGGPGGPPGNFGPPPKPLTVDEVGLVRAWIEQGAK